MHRLLNLLDNVHRISIDRYDHTYYLDCHRFDDDGALRKDVFKGGNLPDVIEQAIQRIKDESN